MQIVNQTIPRALVKLGYQNEQVEAIVEHIGEHGNVIDAPGLRPEHYEVFDCAMGERSISPMGHVRMMAAVQPFISGAVSNTVNMPESATIAGVMDAFSIAISIGLQYGVPLEAFVSKFVNMRFDPAGMTDDPDVRMAQSVMDYIFRRLALDYLPYDKRAEYGIFTAEERAASLASTSYGA